LTELVQCLRLRPNDAEALQLQTVWKQPGGKPVAPPATQAPVQPSTQGAAPIAGPDADPAPDPLERIMRSFDASAFRQAAQMLDQVGDTRLSALAPLERARTLAAQARSFLDRGLLLEAERLYLSAVAADGNCAEAHSGLALVRERTGDANDARMEAHQALELKPSADAYLVLGRLDLAANHLPEAGDDVAAALKLEPSSQAAQELSRQVQAKAGH
jgi:tetratricopeptide (TPR) repeat protein